jgi:Nucleotide-diphospho-sugar transferase
LLTIIPTTIATSIATTIATTKMDTKARNSYSNSYSSSKKDTKRKPWSNLSIATLVLLAAVTGGHVGYEMGSRAPKPGHVVLKNNQHICEEEERPREQQQQQQHSATDNRRTCIEFPESIGKLAVGMSLVPRRDFADKFDAGVPLQPTAAGNEHVLILHSHPDAMPPATDRPTTTPSVEDATANCDYLNVILTDVDSNRKQCIAIMGQYEAPHLQKWMRLPATGPDIVSTEPLHFVGRLMKELRGGSDSETTPFPSETKDHWDFLRNYTQSLDSILNELRPLAEKVATKNTVVVMFSNYGQSELIVNFICSAHNRNIDLSSVLFFATDPETKELVEGLGMHVFYSQDIFGNLPSGAAKVFGDKTFADMMRAKIMCLHLTNLLGYDVLFQDADVIWYRDPLPYFEKELLQHFDVLMADDGNNLAS